MAIELLGAMPAVDGRVRVLVERRGDRSRRAGHQPPVIHEDSWKAESGLSDLYRIASDNVAIARGLLRLGRSD